MKKKLLKTMIALIAIAVPSISYAQSQEAVGTYNGQLTVSIQTDPEGEPTILGSSKEDVKIEAGKDDSHIKLVIEDFKFSMGPGIDIPIGTIEVPEIELQKSENTITLLPKSTPIDDLPVGPVTVNLKLSTIINQKLNLTLSVVTEDFAVPIDVTFEGTKTGGSGTHDITAERPNVYYDAEGDILIVQGAENQKYEIYNVAGVQTLSGVITTDQINVSALSRGLYLAKIGNSTVKFIKK